MRACWAVVALLLTSCGERIIFPVDGAWLRGGISGDHSGIIVMLLKQDGNNITGSACRTSSGHLIYRDTPVTGRYPRVGFQVLGCQFEGGITSTDQLVGSNTCNDTTQQWFFQRASPSDYNACVNASP